MKISKHLKTYIFDVKVEAIVPKHRFSIIYDPSIPTVVYRHFEREKNNGSMNNEIEIGSFTPLVFSTLRGGMGHAAQCCILQKTCSP